jgi:recombination protein RecA
MPRGKKKKVEEFVEIGDPIERFFKESAACIGNKFGEEVVSSAADEDKNLKYLEVPDIGLQWALGRKGFALGRILYVMGFEGASKTSFALWTANLAFRAGGFAAMVETEQAGSSEHMKYYLDDPRKMRIYHPTTIEDAMEMSIDTLDLFAKIDPEGRVPKVLILDSIAGSSDARSEEDGVSVPKVGGFAKLIKDSTNVIKNKLKETNTLWVVLNQGRDLIQTGFAGMVPEMDKIVATGGRAIPFAATYWLILKKQAAIKEGGEKAGFKVKMSIRKNKLREPYGETYYNVRFRHGLDFTDNTLEALSLLGTCGLEKGKAGYFCEEAGVLESSPISASEMYRTIHQPENLIKFQEELDVITKDECLTYNQAQMVQNDRPSQDGEAESIS